MNTVNNKKMIECLINKPVLKSFIEKFNDFTQAPSGISKLKDLILKLAIEGRLNTSSSNDIDAQLIIDQIRASYAEWSHLKKPPSFNEIQDSELPYSKPISWSYVRLGEIISISSGDGLTKSKMEDGNVPVYGGNGITGFHSCGNVSDETLVIGRVGYYCGSVHLTEKKAWVTDNAFITRYPKKYIYLPFLVWLLKSTNLQQNESSTAQPVISGKKVYPLVVGFPPIEEQKRIVAKVDELMALCDQLEAQQQQQANTLIKANTAAIQALLSSDNSKDDLKNNWQRLASNFHTLYGNTLPMPPGEGRQKKYLVGLENLKQFRQSILHLAVTGKLTSFVSDDEDGELLFKRIQEKKNELIKDKVIPRRTTLNSVDFNEHHSLKDNWYWCLWDDISLQIGDVDHKMPAEVEEGYPYISPRDFFGKNEIDFDKSKKISESDYLQLSRKIKPEFEDLIFPRYGTIGVNRFVTTKDEFLASYSCAIIKTMNGYMEPKYIYYYSLSPLVKNEIKKYINKTTQPNVGIKSIKNFVFPLPPIEEQKRIVTKVDELMALCDQLEQHLTTAYDDAEKLIAATTKALVA